MRIKRSRLKQYSHRRAISKRDREGNSYTEYGPASSFMAEFWPAGGKLQAEIYGQRLSYIYNCRINGTYTVKVDDKGSVYYDYGEFAVTEGDGICLYASGDAEPDYKIIAIKPYKPLYMEIEKI